MAPQQSLWVRTFTRDSGLDVDSKADASLLKVLSGDFFGWFLQQNANLDIDTLNKLVSIFWNGSKSTPKEYSVATYCIADGAFIKLPISFANWFNPHIRFLTVIKPQVATWNKAQLFIVGSNEVNDPSRFLQVASWDTKVFNFYGREQINGGNPKAWVYQGNSLNAFGTNEYLGPFNGHVNGACIMKELHDPWYHWYSGKDTNVLQCFSQTDVTTFQSTPWLTAPGQSIFMGASVGFANDLEPVIESTVTKWYPNRLSNDLAETVANGSLAPKKQPSNIPRWMAHFLLTTTINIATSTNDGQTYTAPLDHFINIELLSQYGGLLPFMGSFDFTFDIAIYQKARASLGLSLLQEVDPDDVSSLPPEIPKVTLKPGTLGGGKQTGEHDWVVFIETAANTEGIPFVILQSSLEDAQGVMAIQQINLGNGFPESLLSDKAFQALTMIDFCNPIYSWRRGVLWHYVPSSTTLQGQVYDFEANFVSAIRNSAFAKNPESPECQFLAYYDGNKSASDYQDIIAQYLTAVATQLNTDDGMTQYLLLAESRRRIYRPLPLDEFGFTLPYATKIPLDSPFLEMSENGKTQAIPSRGLQFLLSWSDTLWSFDPKLLPQFQNITRSVSRGQIAHQRISAVKNPQFSGCPVMKLRRLAARKPKTSSIVDHPTWSDQVGSMFSSPYWIANASVVGSGWRDAMCYWSPPQPQMLHLDLADATSVQSNAVTIYQHLRSKSMPITADPAEYWPEAALETFRLWANQGFRKSSNDPIVQKEIIPRPNDLTPTMRVRKDILSLSDVELRTYRAKIDDILQVGQLNSKWQEIGLLHAEWCLHYQEATFFWHRAFLRHVEELIDFPIPYWNGFAKDTNDPNSPHAGIPPIFLEENYIHPSGQSRPNPLRYALAWNGRNKQGTDKFVQRAQVLLDGPKNPGWAAKIALFDKYHQQIQLALSQGQYSFAQGGIPWDNLPAFSDDQPDDDYPLFAKETFFDGHFEQAHDNYHGWVGPDMADNTYTAFDPIFLSYHANMDRIVEMYLRANPTQSLTTSTPLQPFIDSGRAIAYSDPRIYLYATTGDMSKDTKALQYLYAPPSTPDYFSPPKSWNGVKPTGGASVSILTEKEVVQANKEKASSLNTGTAQKLSREALHPYVIFNNVTCTKESFQIDVFVKGATSHDPHPMENPDYIGRVTRLGMGPKEANNSKRCHKPAVTRILDAECVADRLGKGKDVDQVVTHLTSGEIVDQSEWKGWDGFTGDLMWALE